MSSIMLVEGVEDVVLRDPWEAINAPYDILVKHGPGVDDEFTNRVVAAILGSIQSHGGDRSTDGGEGRYELTCSDDPAIWAAWTLKGL